LYTVQIENFPVGKKKNKNQKPKTKKQKKPQNPQKKKKNSAWWGVDCVAKEVIYQ